MGIFVALVFGMSTQPVATPNDHNAAEHQAKVAREKQEASGKPPLNEHDQKEHDAKNAKK